MFANEDEGFQELFDVLLAYSSTKQSIQMSESERPTRKDDPMGVDALAKGQEKKVERKGQARLFWQRKGQQRPEQARAMSCAGTVASLATTRRTADKSGDRTKVGQKQVREVANTRIDGFGVVTKLKDGGQRQIGRVQDSG